MDFPRFAGPNGILAEQIGTAGSYSPATRPEIFYHRLPSGFYRLIVTLAQNNGATTPYHAVTNFQILHGSRAAPAEAVPGGQGLQRQGRRTAGIAQYFTLYSWW